MSAFLGAASALELAGGPSFLLSGDGAVLWASVAARQLLGLDPVGRSLADFQDGACALASAMAFALRTSQPAPCALTLVTEEGPRRLRGSIGRVRSSAEEEPVIALRLSLEDSRFQALNRTIEELNSEVRQRRRAQTSLQESLDRNRLLLRELQHRVKNTIQMVVALLDRTTQHGGDPRFGELARQATQRLLAVSKAHELMYRSGEFGEIPARPFLESLAALLAEQAPAGASVRLGACADWSLPHEKAHALALVVNELVTNALKHGLRDGKGIVEIALTREDDHFLLTVRDNGPGFAAPPKNSFGLTLVHGLCRQIGAKLELSDAGGALCSLRIRDDGKS